VLPAPSLGAIVWSPDSAKLASVDDRQNRLLLIDPQTGAMTTLATGRFETPSFSPDSTKLAYVQHAARASRGGGTLKVIDLATHAITTLRAHTTAPVWGPREIAFATVVRRPRADHFDIAVIRPDGTHLRKLTHVHQTRTFFGLQPTAWSADDRRRYVIGQTGDAECCGFALTNIVRVPWSGGARQVLLRHAMFASFNG
jgi:Tol biopolymer transport system component